MAQSFKISTTLPATAKRIYSAWLSGKEHAAFTGERARVDPKVGGRFTAFGDYIKGTNLELQPNKKIVQAWRTTEFPADGEDSRLEVTLERVDGGTKLTLTHSNIPDGQADSYKDGWKKFYFKPMKEYFGAKK
ncbi:MAG TPA: SRPBCC family protein [Candidatus Acidoferrales bacterium]|nr:SRPBCC family protein [Candidatus Acidoferrales bacterium]